MAMRSCWCWFGVDRADVESRMIGLGLMLTLAEALLIVLPTASLAQFVASMVGTVVYISGPITFGSTYACQGCESGELSV